MGTLLKTGLLGTGALALAACATGLLRHDRPAVLTDPTPRSHAELVRLVRAELNGAPVTIADDALTRDSLLIIERARPRDAEGRPLVGRETERPERFRLVRNGTRCILVHEATGERRVLASATCVPQQAPGSQVSRHEAGQDSPSPEPEEEKAGTRGPSRQR